MRVAIIHDWLNGFRGGERVLKSICELYPQADIYTLIYEPETICPSIESHQIKESLMGKITIMKKKYRHFLLLMPFFIRQFNLKGYDLIISSSHCVAKGVRTWGNPHICYIHSPMRYMWDQFPQYFGENNPWIIRTGAKLIRPFMQKWDKNSNREVSQFIANSKFVARRVQKYYDRTAEIIYPPVDINDFQPSEEKEDYYLIVSALVPYKRVDLAIQAFNELGKPLKIIGKGPERERLQEKADSNIEFLGWQTREQVASYLSKAKAFIYPQVEDFGITAVEAQASGTPVIAFRKGGATETIIENKTGVFFDEQTPQSLIRTIKEFEKISFSVKDCVQNSQKFSQENFKKQFQEIIRQKLK